MINEKQAKSYCREDISKIENYDKAVADKTQTWCCHHRTAIWWNCSRKDLIENDCYYNRKALELIFLTKSEHRELHKNHSEETKKKISDTISGSHWYNNGVTEIQAHECPEGFIRGRLNKISESLKGRTSPMKGKTHNEESKKKISEAHKGELNSFYGKTHSEETRKKISEANKGKTWKLINGKRVWISVE